jgi:chloramphenicol 3-O-phosphotransferase
MMGRRIPMISGDEWDALTRWRQYRRWPAGVRAKVKRGYRRRERRAGRRWI